MKTGIFFINCIILVILSFPLNAQTIFEYTHYPLTAAQTAPPAILILIDNSRSMHRQAYEGEFDPRSVYYGYFEPSAQYAYRDDSYFERNAAGNWNGNFLNWLSMRRIDILRKVLIGGKAVAHSRTGSGSQQLVGEEDIKAGYDFLKQCEQEAGKYSPEPVDLGLTGSSPVYFGLDKGSIYVGDEINPFSHYTRKFQIRVQKESTSEPYNFIEGNIAGVLQRVGSRARFGLEVLNEDGEGGTIINPIGDDLHNLITNIENINTTTFSPLAESLFEGVRYFMQVPPYYAHAPADYKPGEQSDPFFFQETSEYLHCSRSFVILISDGESTHDLNIPLNPPGGTPGNLRDYDGDARDPGPYAEEGSDYLDDIALWAHVSDLRRGEQDLQGDQKITLFTVSAFGSGSGLLKDAAINGGFIDLNGNDVPDLKGEWDSDEDGIPDNYFEVADGSLLEEKLIQTMTRIFQRTASESGLTIASHALQNEASLFQAFFKPYFYEDETEIHWAGFLHALWVDAFGNIREDTDGDKALVYKHDKIIELAFDEYYGESTVKVFSDADGDGSPDQEIPDYTRSLEEIHPIWEAGERLALKSEREREIKTYVDSDGDAEVDPGEFIDFTPENAAVLRPYLRAADDSEAARIISYIRGEEFPEFRKRTVRSNGTEQVWKLGDIVHSTPAVSYYPMENYHLVNGDAAYGEFFTRWKERPLTIFAGANDGMIHAFAGGSYHPGDNPGTSEKEERGWYGPEQTDAGAENIGDERWAYIPYNLLPHLKWLTRREYTHMAYVDLKPRITDARIFTDGTGNAKDGDHPGGWGTILIGGMGLGGGSIPVTDDFGSGMETRSFTPAYFALDITIPDAPRLLWEFSHPDLAFTTSYPAIVRVEARDGVVQPENDRWFVLFGSGPTDYQGNSNQSASLFVVDLKTGKLAHVFKGEEERAFFASPISIDSNLDFNTDVIYAGESYFSEKGWQGKMYRLSTKKCVGNGCEDPQNWTYSTDPRAWTFSTLFSSPYSVTAGVNGSLDENQELWVYFGTGRYYGLSDRVDNSSENRFFGIKDPCYRGNCTDEISYNQLYDSSEVMIYRGGEVKGAAAAGWDGFVKEVQKKEGWYLTFSSEGERVLEKPGLLGGILSFTTYVPGDTVCTAGGISNLYTLYYQTGTAWKKPITFLTRENSHGNSEEEQSEESLGPIKKKTPLKQGVSSSPAIHIGKTVTIFTNDSEGMISPMTVKPAFKMRSGMESWREE
jgi:type IV pilus assembly protein PilY1